MPRNCFFIVTAEFFCIIIVTVMSEDFLTLVSNPHSIWGFEWEAGVSVFAHFYSLLEIFFGRDFPPGEGCFIWWGLDRNALGFPVTLRINRPPGAGLLGMGYSW